MAEKEKNVKPDIKKSKKEEKNKRHFFKDFKAELKRVVWPTPKQLLNSTIAVITIVLVIGVTVFILDMGFELLNKQNAKIQNTLQEKYSNNLNNNTTSENHDEHDHDHDHDHTDEASSESNEIENSTNTVE